MTVFALGKAYGVSEAAMYLPRLGVSPVNLIEYPNDNDLVDLLTRIGQLIARHGIKRLFRAMD